MMTQGLELTNKNPFKDIVVHGIVRDSQGRKMSKSLGNGIDPIEIIDKYGADALRFSVLSGTTMGNDIRYMPEKLEQASNFANKIWNAAKFITNNISTREEIIESRMTGNLEQLYNFLGKENFENLNDVINKIDYLIDQGLEEKLNKNDFDPLVIQYQYEIKRLEEIYNLIDLNIKENRQKL